MRLQKDKTCGTHYAWVFPHRMSASSLAGFSRLTSLQTSAGSRMITSWRLRSGVEEVADMGKMRRRRWTRSRSVHVGWCPATAMWARILRLLLLLRPFVLNLLWFSRRTLWKITSCCVPLRWFEEDLWSGFDHTPGVLLVNVRSHVNASYAVLPSFVGRRAMPGIRVFAVSRKWLRSSSRYVLVVDAHVVVQRQVPGLVRTVLNTVWRWSTLLCPRSVRAQLSVLTAEVLQLSSSTRSR